MQTIADAAGVTRATVSLALRDSPRISKEVRERIHKLAQELNYRPNPMVGSLMAYLRTAQDPKYCGNIGFVTGFKSENDWRTWGSYSQYYAGAESRLDELGFKLEHFWLREPGMTAQKLSRILSLRGIEGVIIGPLPNPKAHLSLNFGPFSSVALGYSMWRPALHRVCNHQFHAMLTALSAIKHRGYSHAGVAISALDNERVGFNWLAGSFVAQDHFRDSFRVSIFAEGEWTEERFKRWFETTRPQVIVASTLEVWKWAQRLEVSIPEEVGFVDLDCYNSRQFNVSGVDQKPFQMGAIAGEIIATQIQHNQRGIPGNPRITLVEGSWFDGGTLLKKSKRS